MRLLRISPLAFLIIALTIFDSSASAQGLDSCRRALRNLERLGRKETKAEVRLVRLEERHVTRETRWEGLKAAALQKRMDARIANCEKDPTAFAEACSSVSLDHSLIEYTTTDKNQMRIQRKERGLFRQALKIDAKEFRGADYQFRFARMEKFLVDIGNQIQGLEDFMDQNCDGTS